jgi:dihydropyrimidinase
VDSPYDLLIANAEVVTASDRFVADIGILDGKIQALGRGLGAARETIDARGLLALPGGVDAHCHLDQPQQVGRMADDFKSGSRSGAGGGTTTNKPISAHNKGQKIRAAGED